MVFSTTLFLYLYLPIVFILYYITPFKWRNVILLIANFVFYGWGEPIYMTVMAVSILIDYGLGIMIGKYREQRNIAKGFTALSIVMNLGLLVFFKYTDFIFTNVGLDTLGIALPIGISFYTFQKISYIIDVYRRDVLAQKNVVNFAVFVTLFPQLIAGPIIKYHDVDEQLAVRTHSAEKFASGVCTFMVGLCKKVLLANNIGMLWDIYKAGDFSQMSVLGAWLGALAFTFQIYFDFSGYSDMAIGLGRMLGFEFKINFNYPYISQTITDFWRRWHISLSTWFKEYLYIPLGGNRVSRFRWVINLMIVWAATGIWHGASWNFLLWGVYYGVLLVLEKLFLGKVLDRLPRVIRHIYALVIIIVGWVLFAVEDASCVTYIGAMFGANGISHLPSDIYYLKSFLPMLIIMVFASTPFITKLYSRMSEKLRSVCTVVLIIAGLILCTSYLVDATYNPFLYFRF